MTTPDKYTYLYDTLPGTIPELGQVVLGFLLHVFHCKKYGVNISEQRKKEVHLREVEDILQCAIELNDRSLIPARDPGNRVITHCRDYAVLLCSFLRRKTIPAKVPVGYTTYFDSELHQANWICEYRCKNKKKWIQVDTQLDLIHVEYYRFDLDPLNVPVGKFLYAGEEYLLVYEKSNDFYDITRSLIQDLTALNKMEVEVFDVASFIDIDKKQDSETLKLLSRIALITTSPRDRLAELRVIYENNCDFKSLSLKTGEDKLND